jgi:hypothetical protein
MPDIVFINVSWSKIMYGSVIPKLKHWKFPRSTQSIYEQMLYRLLSQIPEDFQISHEIFLKKGGREGVCVTSSAPLTHNNLNIFLLQPKCQEFVQYVFLRFWLLINK